MQTVNWAGMGGASAAQSCPLPTADRGNWFILRTRSRQEKIVASAFRANGTAYFLPLKRVEQLYCGHPLIVEIPVFPGFLFLRGRREDVDAGGCTNRITEVIEVPDQKQLDEELTNIARALGSNAKLDQHRYLQDGQSVEVRAGALKGLQAVVEDRMQRNLLVLQISSLVRAVGLRVDGATVELRDQTSFQVMDEPTNLPRSSA